MALRKNLILRSPPTGPASGRPEDRLRGRLEGHTTGDPADATTAGSETTELGPLPEWDLADLFPGRDSPELAGDLAALAEDATSFQQRYQGRLAQLPGAELGAAVAEYER